MVVITDLNNGDSWLVARNSINNNFDNLNLWKAEKHLSKTTAPTSSDDVTGWYAVWDIWLDETNDNTYICIDSTTSSAVWLQVITATERAKLSGIEANATADQTGAEIKALYEAEDDTNAFDDASVAKLDWIEDGAEVNNIWDADASELTGSWDTELHYHASDRNRANHTGAQEMSTISDAGALAVLNTVWASQIDDEAVTNAKLAHMVQSTIKGRAASAGTWDATDLTPTQVRAIINVADWATANDSDANLKDRANHTGTQTLATISDAWTVASLNAGTGAGNVPVLDGSWKLAESVIPSLAVSEYLGNFTDTTAALADAWVQASQRGDWFTVDTSWGLTYIITTDSPTTTWHISLLKTPTGDVQSVNGNVWVVVLDPDDLDDTATTNKFTSASDISKLAGIEAGADVTDTTNVAAAWALMEAEVTNPAQVKAFDSADYATAAQGVLADSALQASNIGSSIQAHNAKLDSIAWLTPGAEWQMITSNWLGGYQISSASWVKGYLSLNNVDNTSDATKNAATATLANKTIALGSNTVSWTKAQFNTACTDGNFTFLDQTLTSCLTGAIQTVADQDYIILLKAPHAMTITETTTKSWSGTCTATFKINSTALGGTANSVSTSEESQAHASANSVAAGDDIVLTVSSNSSCEDMNFTIKYTATLSAMIS